MSRINLLALHDRRFRIGSALLEGTGLCHPCSRMEEALGQLEGGLVQIGDWVEAADDTPPPQPPHITGDASVVLRFSWNLSGD